MTHADSACMNRKPRIEPLTLLSGVNRSTFVKTLTCGNSMSTMAESACREPATNLLISDTNWQSKQYTTQTAQPCRQPVLLLARRPLLPPPSSTIPASESTRRQYFPCIFVRPNQKAVLFMDLFRPVLQVDSANCIVSRI